MDVIARIRTIAPGAVIPKPAATADFTVKGWGRRRGEEALVYFIPNHGTPTRPHQKGVTVSELRRCAEQLHRTGAMTRAWFNTALPACAKEGACNFTTIGGLFELLGIARYERGAYVSLVTGRQRP